MNFGDERIPSRIWRKIEILPNGCWIWMATFSGQPQARGPGGRASKVINVRRWLFETIYGQQPTGHTIGGCDPRCVHPEHATCAPMSDLIRMRHLDAPPWTHCRRGHEIAAVGFYESCGVRRCKACQRSSCHVQNVRCRAKRIAKMSARQLARFLLRSERARRAWTTRRGAGP